MDKYRRILQRSLICSKMSLIRTSPLKESLTKVAKHCTSLSAKVPVVSPITAADASSSGILLPQQFLNHYRKFASSSSGSSNIKEIKSEEEFNNYLRKVQDEALPAIFYFTAVWCGPCRFLSPIISELSGKYPALNIYKIDIDEEQLQKTLSTMNINSVPTLNFFKDGKISAQVIGADVKRLTDTVESLYA
ncbi:thioredoxin O2, mitochondrial-like [Impatiens glandulifera]|uniref:thioredoxin O2, mitochondrial-like n=1 Tax=Impatiens glandulifera TaxID=253017 RepID=UPI001FB070C2|nr:thioredoxin O2, mitochondrial-like [Impatiens glandulifera]